MKIAVYCGSHTGDNVLYQNAAIQLGRTLAEQSITLVYGGGRVGLMGALSNAALEHGGRVIGVMTHDLVEKEIAHTGLSKLHVVHSMCERKEMMRTLSDGVIALPGGAGTLDELFEAWTLGQLGYHKKPCAFLNVASFYEPLLVHLNHMVQEGFVDARYLEMLIVDSNPQSLLDRLRTYTPPAPKWEGR